MLKSLEIFGFKSFADRTVFDFHPGITAVVGPNGSGKSNVVDAIKWILGDQSAKSLRGKEMTDVIFNGAAGRKTSGFAEATLTLDNSTGFIHSEFQEIQIGRRIMRSGDSEYLINRATARLKDVRELFMGTGAGASAYAIIEQGRVDQILQANATSRRQVFEEAAGISRYKARKAEALRKLERVEQNLLRLTDIVDEVEAQRNATKSQAAKAARFRETSAELKELWLGLAADDQRRLSQSLGTIEEEIAVDTAEVAELNGQLAEAEQRQAALDVELAEVEDRLRAVEQHRSANRETIAGHNSTIRHQTARHLELESELSRLRHQVSKLVARANEAVHEREHNAHSLAVAEDEYARHERLLSQREQKIADFDRKLEQAHELQQQHRLQIQEQMKKVDAQNGRDITLESQKVAAVESRVALLKQRDEVQQEIDACVEDTVTYEARVKEATEQTAVAARLLQELEQQRESLLSEHSQFRKSLAEQREKRSAWQARKSVLEDLEDRQEGLGIGVKEILSRALTSNHPPWNSILGSAADLLTVDLEHAALLEVAVGERSQLIVVKEYAPLVEYLAKGEYRINGRVGFVVPQGIAVADDSDADAHNLLARFKHFGINEEALPDLSSAVGVVGRADQFVQSASQAAGLATRLLSDTWVVETLENAIDLSAADGRGCRFVTRQGELLEPDGTIVVGSVRSETAIVSRKSELRRLKNDLQKLERGITREERRLAGLDDSLAQADDAVAQATEVHREAVAALTACQTDLDEHQREVKRLERDRDKLQVDADRWSDQERQIDEELQQSEQAIAAAKASVAQLEQAVADTEQLIARRSQRRKTLEQRRATEQIDSVKSEERLHGMREAVARLERDLEQRQQQQQEAERRYELVASKASQITLHILNTNAALAELILLDEDSAENAGRLLHEKKQLRDVRSKNQREIDEVRQQRRDRNDALHEREMHVREMRSQLDGHAERIEEEYQISLEEVVASGKSAYAAYLEELKAEQAEEGNDDRDTLTMPNVDDELDESAESAEDDAAAPAEAEQQVHSANEATDETGDEPAEQELDLPAFEDIRDELEARVDRLRRKLKLMGGVNSESLNDLDELEERYNRLSDQLADLVEARNALEDIIRRINVESERMFAETFASIQGHFRELFRKLFGGGEADIVLEDQNDVLECGIDVVARPPGKELRSISLLSGGERTMTAVALLLSIFKSKPSPFCILDEVDAALDEANLGRFVSLLKEFRESTQFIMISHRKPSMTQADVLYGVTMEQSGVSKRMNVRFDDIGEDGSFTASESNTQDGGTSAAA